MLAELFLDACEDDVDDVALRTCTSLFGFHEVERLLAEVSNAGAGYKQWRACFGASCMDH